MPDPPRVRHLSAWVRIAIAALLILVSSLASIVSGRTSHTPSFQAGIPPTFRASFPLKDRSRIHVGTDLYYFHDAVGEVDDVAPGGGRLVVRFHIDQVFLRQWQGMSPKLVLYRGRRDHTSTWIGVLPRGSDGKPMTPSEAARVWGTGV
jgi:hypothetical protein